MGYGGALRLVNEIENICRSSSCFFVLTGYDENTQLNKDIVDYVMKRYEVIDEVNIYEATKLAMYDAINGLKIKPEHVLIDAMKLEKLDIPSTSIIKGDAKSEAIAAASIIAKVTRDRMMIELSKKFPEYGFEKHKGYPTKAHIENVKKYGLLDNYRFTFRPISDLIKQGGKFEREIRKTNN